MSIIISPLSLNSDTSNLNVVLQNACSEIDITYKTVPLDGKWYRTSTKQGNSHRVAQYVLMGGTI